MSVDLVASPRLERLKEWMITTILCWPATETTRDELRAMSPFSLMVTFLNWQDRLIPKRKRTVAYLGEFWTGTAIRLAEPILQIAKLVGDGEDLNRYLSERVAIYGYAVSKNGKDRPRRGIEWGDKDFALNSYDIHHLHLGTKVGSDGWIKRTDELLYVCFERDMATFLMVGNHKSFDDGKLARTAARWRGGGGELQTPYTDQERKQLHRAGYTMWSGVQKSAT